VLGLEVSRVLTYFVFPSNNYAGVLYVSECCTCQTSARPVPDFKSDMGKGNSAVLFAGTELRELYVGAVRKKSENLLTVMSSLKDHNERAAVTGRGIGAKAERSASSGYTGAASQTGVRKGAKAGQSTDELRGQTYRATSTLRRIADSGAEPRMCETGRRPRGGRRAVAR